MANNDTSIRGVGKNSSMPESKKQEIHSLGGQASGNNGNNRSSKTNKSSGAAGSTAAASRGGKNSSRSS